MEQKRNCTIDFLRLLMALLIVALHCNPFAEYNALISYFPSQVLSRIGVPFFAAIAGYYFFQKEDIGRYFSTLCKYCEKYTIWSVIFLGYGFIASKNLRGGNTRICRNVSLYGILSSLVYAGNHIYNNIAVDFE